MSFFDHVRHFPLELENAQKKGNGRPLCAFLDNATIINACSLLSYPFMFHPGMLLDLESFCEAFLFYDQVQTLVGSSFIWAVRGESMNYNKYFPKSSTTRPDLDLGTLYSQLMTDNLLVPIEIGASAVHHSLEHSKVFDEVAINLNLGATLDHIKNVFGDDNPWTKKSEGPDRTSIPWGPITYGTGAYISDTYPRYYLPRQLRASNDTLEDFLSQTYMYVISAALLKRPYICSFVRVPIVQDMVMRLNKQFFSVVHGCLGAVNQEARKKVEAVLRFFGEGAIKFSFLPALFCVLQHSASREDFIPALMRLRQREDITRFRGWCRALNDSWQAQDLDKVYESIQQLKDASEYVCQSNHTQPLDGSICHLPNINLLTKSGLKVATSSDKSLVSSCYNPSLAFLKDVGLYLACVGNNIEMLEQFFECEISPKDLNNFNQLQTHKEQLYSKGETVRESAHMKVERVEVTMGDKFNDIRNSTIVNRSTVTEAFNHLEDSHDEHTIRALKQIAEEITHLHSKEADENFNSFVEELGKQEPRKSVLTSLWNGITKAAPTILQMTDAVSTISKLLTP